MGRRRDTQISREIFQSKGTTRRVDILGPIYYASNSIIRIYVGIVLIKGAMIFYKLGTFPMTIFSKT